MTIRDNSQRSAAVQFRLKLAPELLGAVACRLERATVDPELGQEVILVFTEETAYATRYGAMAELKLVGSSAIVPTPYGPVGALVWQIGAGTTSEIYVEQFINPAVPAMIDLVRDASQQTRLRLAIVDNQSSDLCSVSDFENVYRLDAFVAALEGCKADAKPEQFDEAMQYAKVNGKLIDRLRNGTAA